eukprot:1382362-Amorphochlora_amoeboformis.AAC.1
MFTTLAFFPVLPPILLVSLLTTPRLEVKIVRLRSDCKEVKLASELAYILGISVVIFFASKSRAGARSSSWMRIMNG